MSIFGVLECENVAQVADKTRLAADKSFVTKGNDPILKALICPEWVDDDSEFIDVTGTSSRDWFLDWVYTGITRSVTAKLKLVTVIADPDAVPAIDEVSETFSKTIQVNSVVDDALFSSDTDLTALEPDILKWVPEGRSSWLNIHRAAQEKIIDWLNKSGVEDKDGLPLTKAAVLSVNEVKFWSRDWALAMIYKGIQNQVGDVFSEKAKFYFAEADKGSHRAKLRLDLNLDGDQKTYESVNMTSRDLVRG